MPRHNKKTAGSALLAVVVFTFIVSVFASMFIALVNTNITASNRAKHRQECIALAEGGIDKAAVLLRRDAEYRGEPFFTLGTGEVAIEVVPAEAADHFAITATGRDSADDPAPVRITAECVLANGGVRVVRWEEQVR